MNKRRISLALSGGGARGAYHLGVLQYMDEIGVEIDSISGTSIGALVGVSYASGVNQKINWKFLNQKNLNLFFHLNHLVHLFLV